MYLLVWSSRKTRIIYLRFITGADYVYCAVRIYFLNIIKVIIVLESIVTSSFYDLYRPVPLHFGMLLSSGHQFHTSILYITRLLKTHYSCYQCQYSIETRNIYPVTCLFLKNELQVCLENTTNYFFTTDNTLPLQHHVTHSTCNVIGILMCNYFSTTCYTNLVSLALVRHDRTSHARDLPYNCTVPW